jgi:hypothetical protein
MEEEMQLQRSQKVRNGNVKPEPASSRLPVPATQERPRGSIVEDLGSPSEDDEDDDE